MKLLLQFPTIAMFLTFLTASCLFAYGGFWIKVVLSGIALLSFFAVFFLRRHISRDRRSLLLCVLGALCAAGLFSMLAFNGVLTLLNGKNGRTDTVSLRITECVYTLPYTARYRAVLSEAEEVFPGTGILLDSPLTGLQPGTLLRGEVQYTSLSHAGFGSFDAERQYLPQKIMLCAEDLSLQVTGFRRLLSPAAIFRAWNQALSAKLFAHMPRNTGGVAAGVLLGNYDRIPDHVLRDFRRIGISHLLVVSGSHFSILVTMADTLMRRMSLRRRVRAGLDILLILFLALLTGCTPSVLRAAIMHLLAQISMLVLRRPHLLNSFAFAGTLLLLFNPYAAIDCGMQLSFTATFACLFYLQLRPGLLRALRQKTGRPLRHPLSRLLLAPLESVLVTSLITLNTLPLMWLYFGEIPLLSIPVNLFFVPMVTILLYLTALYLFVYPLRILIFPLAALLHAYGKLLLSLAHFFSVLDGIMLPVRYPFTAFFLLPLSVLLFCMPFAQQKTRRRFFIVCTCLCAAFFSAIGVSIHLDRQNTYFSYLPEKKNDGFVLKADGKALLCEISDGSSGYAYRLTDEVRALHCCEIDTVLMLHYHNKHVRFLEHLLQRELVRHLVLAEPLDERETGIYEALRERAGQYGISVETIPSGGQFSFGNTTITLFERTYLRRSTHPITALEVDFGDEQAVLVSCSFNEGDTAVTEALNHAEYPLFGRHSPVYKKAFGPSFVEEPKALVFSKASAAWADLDFYRQYADRIHFYPSAFRIQKSPHGTTAMPESEDGTES